MCRGDEVADELKIMHHSCEWALIMFRIWTLTSVNSAVLGLQTASHLMLVFTSKCTIPEISVLSNPIFSLHPWHFIHLLLLQYSSLHAIVGNLQRAASVPVARRQRGWLGLRRRGGWSCDVTAGNPTRQHPESVVGRATRPCRRGAPGSEYRGGGGLKLCSFSQLTQIELCLPCDIYLEILLWIKPIIGQSDSLCHQQHEVLRLKSISGSFLNIRLP